MHISDLHFRHNGRLYYSTTKKINNGFILNNYSVLHISDRDIQKEKKSFADNVIEAKNAGLTQLPSRDIPTTGVHHVTDETTNANYIPSPETPEDYIKNHDNEKEYMERARAMNRQKGTFDMLFDEFRVSILVGLLFFLFQLFGFQVV
mgnify:CR=1 FL=1